MGKYKDFEWKSPFKSEGFVAMGTCKRCSTPTFAKSGICVGCTSSLSYLLDQSVEDEVAPAFHSVDCE